MRNTIHIAVVLVTLLFSCKKPEVVPLQKTEETAFKAIASFDTDSLVLDVTDGATSAVPTTTQQHGVYRVGNVFQNGSDVIEWYINDGYTYLNSSFAEKILGQGSLKFSTFNSTLYTFVVDSIKSLLGGGDINLYVDNKLLSEPTYTFPSSGIYSCKVEKNIDGEIYTITNDVYVGFINPYGYLDFNWNATTNLLTAQIASTTLPFTVKWYLDNELISSDYSLLKELSPDEVTKLKAIVDFDSQSISYESLVDCSQATEQVADIKKYSVFFANASNAEDLRITMRVTKDNEIWTVNESSGNAVFTIQSLNYYKEINGKKVYQLVGAASDVKMSNQATGEVKSFNYKIKAGIYLPY